MRLQELFEEEIRTFMNITTDNMGDIRARAMRGIPERLWEFTTPRTEVASFTMKEPNKEELQQMLDYINESVSKAFLQSMEEAARKFAK